MENGCGPSVCTDWKNGSYYGALATCDRTTLLWEWTRRDSGYRAWYESLAAAQEDAVGGTKILRQCFPKQSNKWDFVFAEAPDTDGFHARLITSHTVDPSVVTVDARSTETGFDLQAIAGFVVILVDHHDREYLALSDGHHHLRIDVARGTVLAGPVAFKLHCQTPQIAPIAAETLTRASLVWQSNRMPVSRFPKDRRLKRLVTALRVHDAIHDQATYQDIARTLFGDERVEREWNGVSDSLRSTIRRIARQAERLAAGGYHDIMRQ